MGHSDHKRALSIPRAKYQPGEVFVPLQHDPVYPLNQLFCSQIIVHENFGADAALNDIALLILDNDLTFAPHIDTVCLPPAQASFEGVRCFAAGWGRTSFGESRQILELGFISLIFCFLLQLTTASIKSS